MSGHRLAARGSLSPGLGTTTFVYDTAGRTTQQIGPTGGVDTYAYDALNRVTEDFAARDPCHSPLPCRRQAT